MTNRTTSPSNLIPVETNLPSYTPLTLPTYSPALPTQFPEENGKENVTGDPDPDLTLPDSSKKSNSLDDTNSSKPKKKKCHKK